MLLELMLMKHWVVGEPSFIQYKVTVGFYAPCLLTLAATGSSTYKTREIALTVKMLA